MELLKNTKFEVLTNDGFKSFDGIKVKIENDKLLEIKTNNLSLKCTKKHLIKTKSGFKHAQNIRIGSYIETSIGFEKLISKHEINGNIEVYDLVNVEDGHEYLTNNITSHNCLFRGSSGTLISPTILQDLQFINPIFEDKHLRVYKEYDPKKQYAAFVDTAEGLGKDYSVITVIEVSSIPHEVVCIYKNNLISPIVFPHTIVSICNKYGSCPVLIESNNSSGGQVSYILYYELEYENTILTTANKLETNNASSGKVLPGVKTSRKVKSLGCSNLNTIIENNNLIINSEEILEELGTFILKGSSYEADKDCTDDLVMTLVIYSWYISQETFKEYSGNSLTDHIYNQSVQNAMQNILPFGLVISKENIYESHNNQIKVTTTGSLEAWLKE